jgi:hypothetical protein
MMDRNGLFIHWRISAAEDFITKLVMPAPRAKSNNRLNIRAKSRWEATTTIRFFIYCRWKGTDNLSWAEKIYET